MYEMLHDNIIIVFTMYFTFLIDNIIYTTQLYTNIEKRQCSHPCKS